MNTSHDERMRATGSPIERDGTASDWDAEVTGQYLYEPEGVWYVLGGLAIGFALAVIVVTADFFWLVEP
jgi:hypothetical protein